MIDTEDFLRITKSDVQPSNFRLGKIDPAYTSGRPKIIFDGETTASGKQYPHLASYTPAANDRVLLAAVSGSYVVLGKIM
jgi:hypothetical protein